MMVISLSCFSLLNNPSLLFGIFLLLLTNNASIRLQEKRMNVEFMLLCSVSILEINNSVQRLFFSMTWFFPFSYLSFTRTMTENMSVTHLLMMIVVVWLSD